MLKHFVVRTAPVTHNPMLVDANSLRNGRLTAILENKEVEISEDYYKSSGSVNLDEAVKIVQAYAEQANIAPTEVLVRQRLPKNIRKRHTNDADITPGNGKPMRRASDKQPEDGKQEVTNKPQDDLATRVQAFHDSETQRAADKAKPQDENKQDVALATPDNPEGATVHQLKPKRKYERKSKEQNKRSAAALKRMHAEIQAAAQKSEINIEPVQHNVSAEEFDDEVLKLAKALAKILKASEVL